MQDLDPKCRHFGILWHFMAFYGILWHFGIFAKKSNKKSNPIFPILSDFYFSRLLDFPIPQLKYKPKDSDIQIKRTHPFRQRQKHRQQFSDTVTYSWQI